MNTHNRITKDRLTYLIAFIVPCLVLLGFYAMNGFYPFGQKTVSWCDMNQQVVPLLADLKDILAGRSSLLYSLQNAGGMNFWGVFFFFLSSPFSLLVVFVPKSMLLLFMNILLMLKVATCSVTAVFYLRRHETAPGFSLLLGCLYAFSGYMMLFYQNIIWLDCMYLFPLLMLSFEYLCAKGKNGPYIAAMSAMMIVNYYISYMVVIFTLLYFGCILLSLRASRRTKIAALFLSGSIMAAGLTAFVWIPSFLQYRSSGRETDLIRSIASSDLFTNLPTTIPFLLPSAILILILIYGIIKGNHQNPSTRLTLSLILLFLPPLFLDPINRMWHTGNYQAFPIRWGFMLIFLMMAAAGQILTDFKPHRDHKQSELSYLLVPLSLFVLIFLYGLFSLSYVETAYSVLTHYTSSLWGNYESVQALFIPFLLTAVIFFLILRGYHKGAFTASIFVILAGFLFLVDTYFGAKIYLFSGDYEDHQVQFAEAMDLSNFDAPLDDSNEFYRLKLYRKYFDVNDLGALGKPSLSHYTSLTSKDYLFAMKKLGYSSYWMEAGGYEGTKLTDAVLSVAYEITWENSKAALYKNDLYQINETSPYLSLGLLTSEDLTDTNNLDHLTRFEVQKFLYQKLFPGQDPALTLYPVTSLSGCTVEQTPQKQYLFTLNKTASGTLHYEITLTDPETLYFDCFDRLSNNVSEHINGSFSIYVNAEPIQEKYPSSLNNGLIDLGTFENETVSIDVVLLQNISCASYGIFGINETKLQNACAAAKTLNLKQRSDHRSFFAEYTAAEDSTVFLSLPYDKGLHVYVDDTKVKLSQSFMGFSSFTIPKGSHSVVVSYMPPGLLLGLWVTLLSFLILVAFTLIRPLRRFKERVLSSPRYRSLCSATVILLAILVITAIYLFPMVVKIMGMLEMIKPESVL